MDDAERLGAGLPQVLALDYVDDEAAQGGAYRCREAPLVRRPRAAKCRADLRTP